MYLRRRAWRAALVSRVASTQKRAHYAHARAQRGVGCMHIGVRAPVLLPSLCALKALLLSRLELVEVTRVTHFVTRAGAVSRRRRLGRCGLSALSGGRRRAVT